jgi:hypothetical protein
MVNSDDGGGGSGAGEFALLSRFAFRVARVQGTAGGEWGFLVEKSDDQDEDRLDGVDRHLHI